MTGPVLLCDVSTWTPRPIVLIQYRRQIFDVIHSLAHPGRKATQRLVYHKCVWHSMNTYINQWAKQCIPCQSSKIQYHVRAALSEFVAPPKKNRFSHIKIDSVGPLPPSSGFSYILTIVVRTTRWPEAIPLRDTTTLTCAQALIAEWISRFEVPLDI